MKIRKGTFETNSSSTHSIAISKNPVTIRKGTVIRFRIGEYGWEESEYSFPSYMYTTFLDCNDISSIEKLKSILDKWEVKYSFEEPKYNSKYNYIESGYVDHSYEALPIMHEILNDEDLLARALLGDATVYTGNDNSSEDDCMCYCADSKIWNDEAESYIPNPNHDSEHFDYFFKGN